MRDLNSLAYLPSGNILTDLTDATGINNCGQITVVGIVESQPIIVGIPEPETYAILVAGLALVVIMPRGKREKEFA